MLKYNYVFSFFLLSQTPAKIKIWANADTVAQPPSIEFFGRHDSRGNMIWRNQHSDPQHAEVQTFVRKISPVNIQRGWSWKELDVKLRAPWAQPASWFWLISKMMLFFSECFKGISLREAHEVELIKRQLGSLKEAHSHADYLSSLDLLCESFPTSECILLERLQRFREKAEEIATVNRLLRAAEQLQNFVSQSSHLPFFRFFQRLFSGAIEYCIFGEGKSWMISTPIAASAGKDLSAWRTRLALLLTAGLGLLKVPNRSKATILEWLNELNTQDGITVPASIANDAGVVMPACFSVEKRIDANNRCSYSLVIQTPPLEKEREIYRTWDYSNIELHIIEQSFRAARKDYIALDVAFWRKQ